MAVGIRSYGPGTRGIMAPAFGMPSSGTDDDWSDTGIGGLESTSTSSTSSGLSGRAAIQNAALARQKFEEEQAAAAAAAARTQAGTQASADYIRRLLSQAQTPFGGLEEQIAEQETAGRQYITDQARMLADLISGRRTQAMETTTAGYDALRNYLAANPMQAFAQTQRAVPTVQQGILDQYLASRGISAAPAQAGQDVVNAQLAAQAANYNQLLNVLTGAEAQQQSSRAAEEQMARALAGTQLEALYGAQTAGLEQQRLAALNELASRVATARLQAEQARLAREQALQDAIAKLLGTGYVPPTSGETAPPVDTGGGTTGGGSTGGGAPVVAPTITRPIDILAARAVRAEAAGNDRLANRIADFIEANPNAGIRKIEREFPQIAQTILQTPQLYTSPIRDAQLMEFE